MKTLARLFAILTAFVIVMGVIYAVVGFGSSSTSATPQFERNERPSFSGEQFEERQEHEEGGGGLIFGLVRNIGIVAVFVVAIVLPKNIFWKWKRSTQAVVG